MGGKACPPAGRPQPMSYTATFRCIAGCHGEHALEQAIYRCPTCGDLLEVSHDIDGARATAAPRRG